MMENKPCRRELMDWINVVSFAVDDVKLFLDTHPGCEEALEYFEEFFELQNNQPMNEEQRKYSEDLIRKIQEVKQ